MFGVLTLLLAVAHGTPLDDIRHLIEIRDLTAVKINNDPRLIQRRVILADFLERHVNPETYVEEDFELERLTEVESILSGIIEDAQNFSNEIESVDETFSHQADLALELFGKSTVIKAINRVIEASFRTRDLDDLNFEIANRIVDLQDQIYSEIERNNELMNFHFHRVIDVRARKGIIKVLISNLEFQGFFTRRTASVRDLPRPRGAFDELVVRLHAVTSPQPTLYEMLKSIVVEYFKKNYQLRLSPNVADLLVADLENISEQLVAKSSNQRHILAKRLEELQAIKDQLRQLMVSDIS